MTVYIFLLFCLSVGAFSEAVNVKTNRNLKTMFYFIVCLIMIVIAGFRYDLEADYWHYYNVFYGNTKPPALELGFKLFCFVIRTITNNYFIFCFIVAIISLGSKQLIFSKYRYPFIILLAYYLRFFVLFELNGIRQGLAASFMLIAIISFRDKNIKKYWQNVVAGLLFHSSAVCALFSFFSRKIKMRFYNALALYLFAVIYRVFFFDYVISLFARFIPFVTTSSNTFIRGAQYIINSGNSTLELEIFSIARIIIPGLCFYYLYRDKEDKLLYNMYFIGTMFNIFFWGLNTIAYRLPVMFYLFEGIMINDVIIENNWSRKTVRNYISFLCIMLILLLDFYSFFNLLLSSTTAIPYKNVIFH